MSGCLDCGEEFGPCGLHGETLVQREGASVRTGDELALLYLDDMESLGQGELSPWGSEIRAICNTRLEVNRSLVSGTAWIDDADLVDSLDDVVRQVESASDYLTYWDDGYRIVRPTSDWEG
jgi:hypothetical protein